MSERALRLASVMDRMSVVSAEPCVSDVETVRQKVWHEDDGLRSSTCVVPDILHFVWIGPSMPWWVGRIIERFGELNPTFRIMVHDESVLDGEFSRIYDSALKRFDSKSDVLRLAALRKYGGWYFDCDFIPIKPVREIVERYNIVDNFVTASYWKPKQCVENGLIALTKDSTWWVIIDEVIKQRIALCEKGKVRRQTFGPELMSSVHAIKSFTAVGKVRDFYPLAFPRRKAAKSVAKEVLRTYFNDGAVSDIFSSYFGYVPLAFHFWMSGGLKL